MEGISSSSGVRKGAWSKIEDDLLKACVQLYGEGNWHLVPERAGLNRCRKSCRMRWLNYLKPNIKRGDFSEDEIDMMIRLHKLLGNRWSLISGRLPGRTSNDVKNYWNTYMRRRVSKLHSHKKHNNVKQQETKSTVKPHEVIKPVPRAFSKTYPWLQGKLISSSKVGVSESGANSSGSTNWWETLLLDDDKEDNVANDNTCFFGGQDINGAFDLCWDEHLTSIAGDFFKEGGNFLEYFSS